MTAARVFWALASFLCGSSVYYNKRNGLTADRLLFLAYAMLTIGFIALLRRWGI